MARPIDAGYRGRAEGGDVSDINEVVKDVQQRLRIFEGRYTDHFPRWTLRDYVQVSRLVSEVSTLSDTLRELQARVAELERQLEARIAELASIGDGE